MLKKSGQLFLLTTLLFSRIGFADVPSSCLPASHFSHAGKGWPWILLQSDTDWRITSNPGDSELTKMPENTQVTRKITYDNYGGIGSVSCSYELSDISKPLIIVTDSLESFCLKKSDPSSLTYNTTLNPSDLNPCSWQDLLNGDKFFNNGFRSRGCNEKMPG